VIWHIANQTAYSQTALSWPITAKQYGKGYFANDASSGCDKGFTALYFLLNFQMGQISLSV
jgi:hypothetical protein